MKVIKLQKYALNHTFENQGLWATFLTLTSCPTIVENAGFGEHQDNEKTIMVSHVKHDSDITGRLGLAREECNNKLARRVLAIAHSR